MMPMELAQQALHWYVAAGNATPQCAASRSGDVSSQTTRTIEAEETFTSGQLGLDHPSSRWNTSICSWLYDWLFSKSSSNGSWSSCCRAIVDVVEPSRRTVNDFVGCVRRAIRDGRQRRPPASRTRCFGSQVVVGTGNCLGTDNGELQNFYYEPTEQKPRLGGFTAGSWCTIL